MPLMPSCGGKVNTPPESQAGLALDVGMKEANMNNSNARLSQYGSVVVRPANGGVQRIYRFPNGRGASVVRHVFSYGGAEGLWELAVIRFDGPGVDDFHLDYTTDITSDVLGWLSEEEANDVLTQISELPPVSEEPAPAEEPAEESEDEDTA